MDKIILLGSPGERPFYMRTNIPPLSLGVLQGYLCENGFVVITHDLNVSLARQIKELSKEKFTILYDKDLFLNSIQYSMKDQYAFLIRNLLRDIDFSNGKLVGISLGSNYSFFEIHTGFLIGKYLKEKYDTTIVFGGENVEYLYNFRESFHELWSVVCKIFPYIIFGPGEKVLVRMADSLFKSGKVIQPEALPGVVYYKGDIVVCNTPDEPSLTRPEFSGLPLSYYSTCIDNSISDNSRNNLNHIQFFKWPFPHTLRASAMNRFCLPVEKRKEVTFIPYIFNYNCPFKCAFCVQSNPSRHEVITKDPENVVDDLAIMMEKYKSPYFYFFNNTFNSSPGFVKKFHSKVTKRKLELYWSDCARFNNLDENLIRMMYESGCRKLIFGFETGSEKLLRMIDKRLDLNHAEKIIRLCSKQGIWVDLEVIIGLPHEFDEDFQATCDFILKNREYINTFAVNRYFVVPSSLIGMKPDKFGIELIKNRFEYEDILKKNKDHLLQVRNERCEKVSVGNFRIYSFKEVNGRSVEQVEIDTDRHFSKVMDLYKSLSITDEIRLCNLHLALKRKQKQTVIVSG